MRAHAHLPRAALLAAGLHVSMFTCPRIAMADGTPAAAPAAPPASSTAPPASAGTGGDTIYLKNGGMLRGTIIDVIPGDHARIELATHDVATVSWADVLRVERADDAKAGKNAGPATGGSSTLPASQSMVTVHIEGAEEAQLEQDTTGNDDWTVVCSAPCDKSLSTAYWYRISGSGLKASKSFSLKGEPGSHETLMVSPASKGWFIVGVIAAPAGGVVAYLGLVLGLIGANGYQSNDNGVVTQHPANPGLAATGWTMLGVGAIAAVGGLVLLFTNWKSGVQQNLGGAAAAGSDTSLRLPTWREASGVERAVPSSLSLTVPVLSTTF